MAHQEDCAYFSVRAGEELERGDHASNATVAAIHYELAARYSILAAKSRTGAPKLILVTGGKDRLAA